MTEHSALRLTQRIPDKPRLTAEQGRAQRRVNDLRRLYYDRHPEGLPNNALGVKYAKYICRTMAFNPIDQRAEWLDQHALWLRGTPDRAKLLNLGPYWYSRFALGEHLELYAEDRERLGITSIEAFDLTREQRERRTLDKAAKRQERQRRKNGAKPRSQWLASHSVSRTKPWEAAGYNCRRTWERHGKPGVAGPSRPFLLITSRDGPATSTRLQGSASNRKPESSRIAADADGGNVVSVRAIAAAQHSLAAHERISPEQERKAA